MAVLTTYTEVVARYGQPSVDTVLQVAHERSGITGGSLQAAFDQAEETARETIYRPLRKKYEAQIDAWEAQIATTSSAPRDLHKLCQELVMIILRERADLAMAYDVTRWKQIMDILEKYGSAEYKLEGISTSRAPRTNVDDGRVSITKRSHYDNDGNRIEGENERTPLDEW